MTWINCIQIGEPYCCVCISSDLPGRAQQSVRTGFQTINAMRATVANNRSLWCVRHSCIIGILYCEYHETIWMACSQMRRKHHCRACGELVCDTCAPSESGDLPGMGYIHKVRVCSCQQEKSRRFSTSTTGSKTEIQACTTQTTPFDMYRLSW